MWTQEVSEYIGSKFGSSPREDLGLVFASNRDAENGGDLHNLLEGPVKGQKRPFPLPLINMFK